MQWSQSAVSRQHSGGELQSLGAAFCSNFPQDFYPFCDDPHRDRSEGRINMDERTRTPTPLVCNYIWSYNEVRMG